jgi:hypothetical protein
MTSIAADRQTIPLGVSMTPGAVRFDGQPITRGMRTCVDGVVFVIVCADGYTFSVGASRGHYCTPRDDVGPYDMVEVGIEGDSPDAFDFYRGSPETSAFTAHGWVPVDMVRKLITEHGGIV